MLLPLNMIEIRRFDEQDWSGTWRIIKPVFRAGETYAFSPGITEEEAHNVWIEIPKATYVAVNDGNEVLGTYYIKANQPELGSHVCNCGYIVSKLAGGKGIASRMCAHSQQEAVVLGFLSRCNTTWLFPTIRMPSTSGKSTVLM